MLTLSILGSGSRGNAAVVACGATRVLLDCGFSARETARRIAAAGFDADGIAAVLVTHEHADHVAGVPVFARRHRVPVFASAGTLGAAGLAREHGCECSAVRAGESVRIGDLAVTAFRTSHDCAEPLGYTFEAPDGTRLGIVTDTGFTSAEVLEALAGCHVLGLEVNHDLRMLETGPYPLFLRRRIAGDRGHLSNAAAADALESLAHDGLRAVFGMHVSQQNNLPSIAGRALRARLAAIGLPDVAVAVASQEGPATGTA
ncbi:MAG TPA: MBL fold metallo-hydrolase [Coriobacteriia bacterium]